MRGEEGSRSQPVLRAAAGGEAAPGPPFPTGFAPNGAVGGGQPLGTPGPEASAGLGANRSGWARGSARLGAGPRGWGFQRGPTRGVGEAAGVPPVAPGSLRYRAPTWGCRADPPPGEGAERPRAPRPQTVQPGGGQSRAGAHFSLYSFHPAAAARLGGGGVRLTPALPPLPPRSRGRAAEGALCLPTALTGREGRELRAACRAAGFKPLLLSPRLPRAAAAAVGPGMRSAERRRRGGGPGRSSSARPPAAPPPPASSAAPSPPPPLPLRAPPAAPFPVLISPHADRGPAAASAAAPPPSLPAPWPPPPPVLGGAGPGSPWAGSAAPGAAGAPEVCPERGAAGGGAGEGTGEGGGTPGMRRGLGRGGAVKVCNSRAAPVHPLPVGCPAGGGGHPPPERGGGEL